MATAASTVTPGVTPAGHATVAGFADAVGAVGSAASTAASTVSVQRLARLRGALPSSIAFSRSSFAAPSRWSALARTQSTEFMVGAVGAGRKPPLWGHSTPQLRGSEPVPRVERPAGKAVSGVRQVASSAWGHRTASGQRRTGSRRRFRPRVASRTWARCRAASRTRSRDAGPVPRGEPDPVSSNEQVPVPRGGPDPAWGPPGEPELVMAPSMPPGPLPPSPDAAPPGGATALPRRTHRWGIGAYVVVEAVFVGVSLLIGVRLPRQTGLGHRADRRPRRADGARGRAPPC